MDRPGDTVWLGYTHNASDCAIICAGNKTSYFYYGANCNSARGCICDCLSRQACTIAQDTITTYDVYAIIR